MVYTIRTSMPEFAPPEAAFDAKEVTIVKDGLLHAVADR
jgi:hypothetical protein